MLSLTRVVRFAAAHRLNSEHLSAEENQRIYGKCNYEFGHGHNYELHVTVTGEVDPKTGMVINLTDLETLIQEHLYKEVDHRHLNHDVPFLKDINPTVENLTMAFWKKLSSKMPSGVKLEQLRLYENDHNYADYYGL